MGFVKKLLAGVSVFQYVVLAIFAVLVVAGIIAVATFQGSKNAVNAVPLMVWGTLPENDVNQLLERLGYREDDSLYKVTYQTINSSNFTEVFVNALAEQRGPDIIIGDQSLLFQNVSKLAAINFSNYPLTTYRQNFPFATEIFVGQNEILGLPLLIDPMVMYWNINHFSNEGLVAPPQTWTEVAELTPRITRRNGVSLSRSAVPLGAYDNVRDAKGILSSMLLQSGSLVVRRGENTYLSDLEARSPDGDSLVAGVIRYMEDFSEPTDQLYTWNANQNEARTAFANNQLSMLFAPASIGYELQRRNPNLAFDVSLMPQISINNSTTYATIMAGAVVQQSPHKFAALGLLSELSSPTGLRALAGITGLSPASRTLLAEGLSAVDDPAKVLFSRAAIQARSYPEYDAQVTDQVFETLTTSVFTSRQTISEALDRADAALNQQASRIPTF